jgi:sortase (surface protein transpeptidase)
MTDRPPFSRRRALLGAASGAVLCAAGVVVFAVARPSPAGQTVTDVGVAAALALTDAPPSDPAPISATPSATAPGPTTPGATAPSATAPQRVPSTRSQPATSASSPAPRSPSSPAPRSAPTTPAAATPATPVRISLPDLKVSAPVVPIGVQDNGELQIPSDVGTVGWYRFGPLPGAATGSAVLSGHVDSAQQGPGVFSHLGDLSPGDRIQVTDDRHTVRTFRVVAREMWPKGQVPLDRLFDPAGAGRLVLITCGGTFDEDALSYDDNIAVTAVPVG